MQHVSREDFLGHVARLAPEEPCALRTSAQIAVKNDASIQMRPCVNIEYTIRDGDEIYCFRERCMPHHAGRVDLSNTLLEQTRGTIVFRMRQRSGSF